MPAMGIGDVVSRSRLTLKTEPKKKGTRWAPKSYKMG